MLPILAKLDVQSLHEDAAGPIDLISLFLWCSHSAALLSG